MAKTPPKTTTGRSSAKPGSKASAKGRSRRKLAIRRRSLTATELIRLLSRSPDFGWAMLIGTVFVVLSTAVMSWSTRQPLLSVGQESRETVLARVAVEVENEEATRLSRNEARWRQPRVYVPDEAMLQRVTDELLALPLAAHGADDFASLPASLIERFGIDPSGYATLRGFVTEDGALTEAWLDRIETVRSTLERRPVLEASVYQREQESLGRQIRLVDATGSKTADASGVLNLDDDTALDTAGRTIARLSGLPREVQGVVSGVLLSLEGPTFRPDVVATTTLQEEAASRVQPVVNQTPAGAVIFRKGEAVTADQIRVFKAEVEGYLASMPLVARWLQLAGLGAVATAVAAGVGGYAGLFTPRIRRNPGRMASLGVLMLLCMVAAVLATAQEPGLRGLTLLGPLVFLTAVLTIAYDSRLAIVVAGLQALLVTVALREPAPTMAAMVAGVAVTAWQMSDLRDRRSLIRASLIIGTVLAISFVGASLVTLPGVSQPMWIYIGSSAAWAALAGIAAMSLILFILPTLEKLFDITTGMTLIELRDPKQPLLRELQRRAPGTYNHSLNVASISEQAAEAIGADSLLTYAGVLYHDIGKMNKPEYFVENQSGGPNRHDKLSPAMSLLVIVGHVKDGLELAREFGLPRRLHHFIEGHHGTTLVEYFYERARRAAEAQELESGSADERPEEIEYRYPGPKPQTREVAIVMIADAVESATRTLPDPTPSRIESLVHAIARKRLEDGQFDECGLTLRDLHIIIESIAKSVTAIYHGRIAYPGRAAATGEGP